MSLATLVGPGGLYSSGGKPTRIRVDNRGSVVSSQKTGKYYEAARLLKSFNAATPATGATFTTWSVALATTFTGLVLSNPAASGVNLILKKARFALNTVLTVGSPLSATPALFAGYAAGGITVIGSQLGRSTFNDEATSPTGVAAASATLVGTPRWWRPLGTIVNIATAANIQYGLPALEDDIDGEIILPPGAYLGIGVNIAVVGAASLSWEEESTTAA